MLFLNPVYTEKINFYGNTDPCALIGKFGSPLYVYNERVLIDKIRRLTSMVKYENFKVFFSTKANSSLALLQIACREGVCVDAMSPGEIYVQLAAGFTPERIFYVCNNVSKEEMLYAVNNGITVSVDSVSQLRSFGEINRGGKVALRMNPGKGAGHHEKVVTAGKKTKFGINVEFLPECENIIDEYGLRLVGINQHIGSFFLDTDSYMDGVYSLMEIAKRFPNLEFVDFGGGFGIPYRKHDDESPLDLSELGVRLDSAFEAFVAEYGKRIEFHIEPGRYICAECGVLLGTVHAVKENVKKYVGTDIGFNVLIRPTLYDAYHDIEVYRETGTKSVKEEMVTIVGNICESGDILANDRVLPEIFEGDILGVLDAGAYGYTMSSNYNNRLKPAEVLIRESGEPVLIRERDTLDDLLSKYIKI